MIVGVCRSRDGGGTSAESELGRSVWGWRNSQWLVLRAVRVLGGVQTDAMGMGTGRFAVLVFALVLSIDRWWKTLRDVEGGR